MWFFFLLTLLIYVKVVCCIFHVFLLLELECLLNALVFKSIQISTLYFCLQLELVPKLAPYVSVIEGKKGI